jgi:hypothetical protein
MFPAKIKRKLHQNNRFLITSCTQRYVVRHPERGDYRSCSIFECYVLSRAPDELAGPYSLDATPLLPPPLLWKVWEVKFDDMRFLLKQRPGNERGAWKYGEGLCWSVLVCQGKEQQEAKAETVFT